MCLLTIGCIAMSDFVAVMFVLVALATAGNFAGGDLAFSSNCAGNYLRVCW